MATLTKIAISGYKSIEDMSLDLGELNVLIGANGAGKSNLVSFFKLLNEMMAERLQAFIGVSGGANSLLYYGAKTTPYIEARLQCGTAVLPIKYRMRLGHAGGDTLVFQREKVTFLTDHGTSRWGFGLRLTPQRETHLRAVLTGEYETAETPGLEQAVRAVVSELENSHVFQFHDTSSTSGMRGTVYIHDNRHLRHDGGNLTAVLYKLQETQRSAYRRIVQTIRQIAPWFDDFVLKPMELNKVNIMLNWREKESDVLFGPHQLSDGTLRAMALVTLLLQPKDDLPSVIVIDEPELGLHPYAINVVASLIKEAACHCQIIAATQSTFFLDQFEPQDVVVVQREGRKSTFDRLKPEKLEDWLQEYSLSELWEKNVIGGGPAG